MFKFGAAERRPLVFIKKEKNMRLDEMNKYLEDRGFKVSRGYFQGQYLFIITKDGFSYSGSFIYPKTSDRAVGEKAQRVFLEDLINEFHDAHMEYTVTLQGYGPYIPDEAVIREDIRNKLNSDGCTLQVKMDPSVAKYVTEDVLATRLMTTHHSTDQQRKNPDCSAIKKVIFNDPATIVFWKDGTKTVVKANNEPYDPEKGLAMAISKKILGNKGNYFNEFKKWLPAETPSETPLAFHDISLKPESIEKLKAVCKSVKIMADTLRANSVQGKVETAYHALYRTLHDQKATKQQMSEAIEEALGYIGEALDK